MADCEDCEDCCGDCCEDCVECCADCDPTELYTCMRLFAINQSINKSRVAINESIGNVNESIGNVNESIGNVVSMMESTNTSLIEVLSQLIVQLRIAIEANTTELRICNERSSIEIEKSEARMKEMMGG
jgi:hypothetical protein